MNDLLQDAANRACAYLNGLDERGVAPTREALLAMSGFSGAWPEKGLKANEKLRLKKYDPVIRKHCWFKESKKLK